MNSIKLLDYQILAKFILKNVQKWSERMEQIKNLQMLFERKCLNTLLQETAQSDRDNVQRKKR